jgi:osmotically-inducible protein OsmY
MSEQRNQPPLSKFLIDPTVYHTPLPDTREDGRGEKLAVRIARVVTRRTAGSVQNLRVEVRRDGVYLDGQCPSYYAKQLAQQAAMDLADEKPLTNRIEVVSHG